jgi:TonB family protein
MNEVVLYLIKSLLAGALFYGFYQFAMRRESYFRLSRFYLLISALLIVILPFIGSIIPLNILTSSVQTGIAIINLPDVVIYSGRNISTIEAQTFLNWGVAGYLVVTLAMLIGLVLSIFKIARFYQSAKRAEKINDNIYLIPGQGSPFSFLGRIFLSKQYLDHPGLNNIIIHENAHIQQYHVVDLFFLELLSSLLWFNPFFFLIKKAIREVHEYLADREVINHGAEPVNYQQLLFNEVSGNPQYIIANNFNLLTKKRIIMLIKKSGKMAVLRIGAFLPVILVAAFMITLLQGNSSQAQNTKQTKNVNPTTQAKVTDQKVPTPPTAPPPPPPPPPPPAKKKQTSETKYVAVPGSNEQDVFTVVEEMPEYPGGQDAMVKYMVSSIVYPAEAKQKKIEGTVYVSFIVEKDGSVTHVKVIRGIGGGCDEESVRVVKGMPKWIPGKQRGKTVRCQFNLPVKYALN